METEHSCKLIIDVAGIGEVVKFSIFLINYLQ